MSDIKMDSIGVTGENYRASFNGEVVNLEPHKGGQIAFFPHHWPEIQAVINAAIAGFDRVKEHEEGSDE